MAWLKSWPSISISTSMNDSWRKTAWLSKMRASAAGSSERRHLLAAKAKMAAAHRNRQSMRSESRNRHAHQLVALMAHGNGIKNLAAKAAAK